MFNYENCWLNYSECADKEFYSQNIKNIYNDFEGKIADNCEKELEFALAKMCGCDLKKSFDSELKSNTKIKKRKYKLILLKNRCKNLYIVTI